MDRLYEQMRARYSNSDRKELERNNTREGQAQAAQPKKAVSFKEGKKVKWFQGPLSGQTSQVDELSDGEFATAIAAAAYAINSLGEGSPNKKMPVDGLHTTFTKTKSKKENSDLNITNSGRISRWFSGKKAKEDGASVGETSMRKSEARDSKALEDPTVNLAKSGKGMGTVPSIKKTPTFSDKYLHGTGSKRFPGEEEKITGQNASATGRTPTSRIGSGKSNLINSGHTDTKADAWEKAQMAKIKRRYEKTYASILEWENVKKNRAKRLLEQKERELEVRRATALQEYKEETTRIEKIAAGARTLANEKKQKDEYKTKDKAKGIRSTGKIPRACVCF